MIISNELAGTCMTKMMIQVSADPVRAHHAFRANGALRGDSIAEAMCAILRVDPSELSELDKQYRPYFVITSCAPMSWAVLHLAL